MKLFLAVCAAVLFCVVVYHTPACHAGDQGIRVAGRMLTAGCQ